MLDIPKTNLVSTIEVPGLQTNPLKIGVGSKEKAPSSEKAKSAASLGWKDFVVRGLAEFFGTFILVYMGCMSCVHIGEDISFFTICLTFGIAVLIGIQIFGHISGSHMNPCVTVAALILGEMDHFGLLPVYAISQLAGSTVAYLVLWAQTPSYLFQRIEHGTNETLAGYCVNQPHKNLEWWQATLVEVILTCILIWVCGGIWDKRNANHHDSIPIRFGLAITGLAMSGVWYSGASMNPARSFGPALVSGHWTHHWIYWVGPFIGTFLGAYSYKYIFQYEWPEEEENEEIPLQHSPPGKR